MYVIYIKTCKVHDNVLIFIKIIVVAVEATKFV